MAKDIHRAPFDDGTLLKLLLYRYYLQAWLPVFLAKNKPIYKTINIFDFFCGPGMDSNNNEGSPLIAIKELLVYSQNILKKNLSVNLYFNEYKRSKLDALKAYVSEQNFDQSAFKIFYSSEDFQTSFNKRYIEMMKKSANFLFLDQNGVKNITDPVFKAIINLPTTDFMFFISSSTISRFSEHPEIRKYIRIPKSRITARSYLNIHRVVLDHYRGLIPKNKKYFLAPFTIKKGANIYGLIFGSGHILGIDKFLTQCWKIDTERGEANFDIDGDNLNKDQLSFFRDMNLPKKTVLFEKELSERILNKSLNTNKLIYEFALSNGFLPKHAREAFKILKDTKKIPRQQLNISRNSCKESEPEQMVRYF